MSAEIIKTKDSLIIYPVSKTVVGLGIATEPYVHLSINTTDEIVVKSILDALKSARTHLPHPEQSQWKEIASEHLANLKFKSYTQLHKLCLQCGIEQKGTQLHFMPTLNHIAKKHFTELTLEEITISYDESYEKIMTALNLAFQRCQPEL
jgi:hypothetical protein